MSCQLFLTNEETMAVPINVFIDRGDKLVS